MCDGNRLPSDILAHKPVGLMKYLNLVLDFGARWTQVGTVYRVPEHINMPC